MNIPAMVYQPKDAFYRKAKKQGYRSRAAYKLSELNRRYRVIKPGDRVIDLGAAPGGWLQVAAELVGPKGRVVGVDLQPITPFREPHLIVLQGDITSEECIEKIREALAAPANCVLSDVSPRLTGIRDADVSRSVELARMALNAACDLLLPGGNFLVKTFMSEELNALSEKIEEKFWSVDRTRPEATRKGSSEIYLCARGYRGSQAGR